MRIAAKHSHMNGEEYLLVRNPKLWQEISDVISSVGVEACKIKVPQENAVPGKMLYSTTDMNRAMNLELRAMSWCDLRNTSSVVHDELLLRQVCREPKEGQEAAIRIAGYELIVSYGQTSLVKSGVVVQLHFVSCAFGTQSFFAENLRLYTSGIIDVGIEIFPMKLLESETLFGGLCYEQGVLEVKRQGRGVPAVPLVLVGVAP